VLEPLRTALLLASLIALIVACGAAPAPAAKAPVADPGAKLEVAERAHGDLATQLSAAPHDILAFCKTTSGDCLISLAERREALVSKHYLNSCRDSDAEKQSPCIVHELEQRGERAELASYYETENWCSRKLLECMTAYTSNAEQMAIRQRTQDRRQEVEAAPESAAAQRLPEFAKEKRAFVRSILPPQGQAECPPSTAEACEKTLDAPKAEFEAELAKAPAAYDAKRALELYAALQRAKAQCGTRELDCLQGQLPQYGASAETDKLLKQNLTFLTQQQSIRASADPETAEQCISAGVTQHSDRIVSAYQAYAAAPASPALLRLLKAFIVMHQAQLWCLTPLGKSGKR
jgi:hypothetical protein